MSYVMLCLMFVMSRVPCLVFVCLGSVMEPLHQCYNHFKVVFDQVQDPLRVFSAHHLHGHFEAFAHVHVHHCGCWLLVGRTSVLKSQKKIQTVDGIYKCVFYFACF